MRAADHSSVAASELCLLGESSFAVDSRHAEEGGEPHPEYSSRTSGNQGSRAARYIAGSDLCRYSCSQGLEGAHSIAAGFFTVEIEYAEHALHGLAEMADLNEPCADRIEYARSYEQKKQDIVPKEPVDLRNDVV